MNDTNNCTYLGDYANQSSADDLLQYSLVESVSYIENIIYVCDLIFSIIGIPVNLFVIGVIIFWKRLHIPRNFTWIGIGVSNISLLISHLIEDVSVRWKASSWTPSLCTWLVVLSIASQTLNFNFAVVERYISISYPKWHKKYVTTVSIIFLQMGCMLLTFLSGILNFSFVLGEPSPHEFDSQWDFQLIGSFIIGILPICLTGQVVAMGIKTSRSYSSIESIQLKSLNKEQQPKDGDMVEIEQLQGKSMGHFVLIGENRVSLFELEAARSIYFISKVYLMFMTPILLTFIAVSLCFQFYSSSQELEGSDSLSCSTCVQGFYYTAGLMNCIHSSIANPISFVFVSHDLLSVLVARSSKNTASFLQEVSCAE